MTTKTKKLEKISQKWDNTDKWVKRVLGLIATIGTIVGIVSGITGWVTAQLDTHFDAKIQTITQQIEELNNQSNAADKKLELSNTRLELTTLMTHNPKNVIEIERVAKYYFIELKGDWYMSQLYSDWAEKYGGDTSFVTHHN